MLCQCLLPFFSRLNQLCFFFLPSRSNPPPWSIGKVFSKRPGAVSWQNFDKSSKGRLGQASVYWVGESCIHDIVISVSNTPISNPVPSLCNLYQFFSSLPAHNARCIFSCNRKKSAINNGALELNIRRLASFFFNRLPDFIFYKSKDLLPDLPRIFYHLLIFNGNSLSICVMFRFYIFFLRCCRLFVVFAYIIPGNSKMVCVFLWTRVHAVLTLDTFSSRHGESLPPPTAFSRPEPAISAPSFFSPFHLGRGQLLLWGVETDKNDARAGPPACQRPRHCAVRQGDRRHIAKWARTVSPLRGEGQGKKFEKAWEKRLLSTEYKCEKGTKAGGKERND